MGSDFSESSKRLAAALSQKQLTLVTAESCTGGLLAAMLTEIAGSSDWFQGAFVTYQLAAKRQFLGVTEETLERWGAVSEPTAREMATGALEHSTADLSVAITGVAGPDGGKPTNPTGTVWLAWARRGDGLVQASQHRFPGGRSSVRKLAAATAVEGLLLFLEDAPA